MSQATNGKYTHTRSLSDLPQTLLSQEGLLFQSPQRAAQLMGFSTPKVNKNRYKLKPLSTKKTRYGEGDETPIETTSRFTRVEKKSLSIVTDPNFSHDASTPLGSQSAALGSSSKFSKNLVSATTKHENRPLGHVRSGSDTKLLVEKHNLNFMTPKKENSTKLIPIADINNEDKSVTRFLAESRQNKEKFKSVRESIAASSRPSVREEVVPNQVSAGLNAFRHLIFQPTVHQEALQKYASLVMRGLNYSINLLRPPPMEFIKTKQFAIQEPKDKPKKTLLLDLDETLIHSNPEMVDPERLLPIPGDHMTPPIRLKIRPHARKFLRRMKEHYEIFVFTAACPAYAQLVVKELDPENKLISYILDRSHCLETRNGLYIKDLRIVKNRDLKNMIIVDNLVHSFGFQIDNGIPILEWRGQQDDEELKYLTNYLLEAKRYDDIREFNRERLKLTEVVNYKLDENNC